MSDSDAVDANLQTILGLLYFRSEGWSEEGFLRRAG